MQGRKRIVIVLLAAVVVMALVAVITAVNFHKNSDALWHIVNQRCMPGQQEKGDPSPCRQVNIPHGYVVLKDRNGPLQFLLLPVAKIAGIESQKLLNPATPNYFSDAWRARHFMEERAGKRLDDRVYSLAINSQWGRTQNQLHIHISCLRADIRRRLDDLAPALNARWQTYRLGEHDYQLRTVTRDEFKRTSPFILIAAEIPQAREQMGRYGLAVAALADGSRVLMVVKRNWLMTNRASAEELQDHDCALLK